MELNIGVVDIVEFLIWFCHLVVWVVTIGLVGVVLYPTNILRKVIIIW